MAYIVALKALEQIKEECDFAFGLCQGDIYKK